MSGSVRENPTRRDAADLLDHGLIVEPPIEARRPDARGVMRRLPRHPQRPTDRGHRVLGHRPDPLRNHGLFFHGSRTADAFSLWAFKRGVVQQLLKGDQTLAEVSRELDIQPSVVRQWKRW